MLASAIDTLFAGLRTVGGLGLLWGLVTIGTAFWGSHGQTSGTDISPGLMWCVGGGIVLAVGIAGPVGIDFSWAS